MKRLYAERRRALGAGCLTEFLGKAFTVEPAAGGMHLVLRLPPGRSDIDAAASLYAHGLGGRALSTLAIRADPGQALLLSFTDCPGRAGGAACRPRAPGVARMTAVPELAPGPGMPRLRVIVICFLVAVLS